MSKKTFIIAVVLIISLTSFAGLNSLFYCPDSITYSSPEQNGYAFESVPFQSKDGTQLKGWFIPAQGKALGTVVHFHGNAQNMSAHYSFVSWLPAHGFNLFTFDYRGYGESEGKPTRNGVYADAVAAMNYIKTRKDIDQSKIIVFGQSIGGANALAVLGDHTFDGIVGVATDSAFATYKSVAGEHAGPFKLLAYCLIGNKHSPVKDIKNIAPIPLLIIHGTHDRVASFDHAKRLFKAAKNPKELWTIKNGGHTAALGTHIQEYAPKLHAKFVGWVSNSPEDR